MYLAAIGLHSSRIGDGDGTTLNPLRFDPMQSQFVERDLHLRGVHLGSQLHR